MNNTTSLQDTLQDKKKLNELEQWLKEDKSICKADRDYILDFITKNYIPREKVDGLKMKHWVCSEEFLRVGYNSAVDEINQKIEELIK